MATLDASRTAFEIDELELTVANLLLNSPDDKLLKKKNARRGIAALEEAGIAVDGVIEGYPAVLLQVVLQPEIRVMVERFVTDDPLHDVAAVAAGTGVWGVRKPGGATEFTPIEPELIPWEVARTVGLGPRPRSRQSEPLEFRGATLDAALAELADGDLDAAAAKLGADPGLTAASRDVLMEVLLLRRVSWRALSLWTNDAGEEQAARVSALDAGDAGIWLTNHTSGKTKDVVVSFEPTEPSVVWDRIVELVPYPVASSAAPVV